MPRYHFHVHNDVDAADEEGEEFSNLEAAKVSAITNARELMSNEVKYMGRLTLSHSIEITDELGVRLHVTRYGDCVVVRP